ncbi:MAG: RHS repeat-associated core domain-containing protein [Spirochaetales bacterium]|nr:RHS repeat-associated core domain-containing protein [Spirochaetales bacterium]
MNKIKIYCILLLVVLLFTSWSIAAQDAGDTRYNSHMNLPFNAKEGDFNPQTGDIAVRAVDIALPGRGGYNFTFERIWSSGLANVFNMYFETTNKLNSNTIDKQVHMGVGWTSSVPFILENTDASYTTLSLFFNTGVYEIDRTGIESDRDDRSNLAGYDLLDKRIHKSDEINYGMFDDNEYGLTLAGLGRDTEAALSSYYVLILKSKETYWFTSTGKLMMQEDVCHNRIWYFYDDDPGSGERLALVVDTIGREITFAYTAEGNLSDISWEVEKGVIGGSGIPVWQTESRSISYGYENAETLFPEEDWTTYQSEIPGYRTPFLLTSVRNPVNTRIGTETRYDYTSGAASFTYDSIRLWPKENIYALITAAYEHYGESPDLAYKSKQCYEYDNPGNDPHRKDFYAGYMDTYKLSRRYMLTRKNGTTESVLKHEKKYFYYDEGENGNYNQYQTIINSGNRTDTYTYSLDTSPGFLHVLTSRLTETEDGSTIRTNYEYDSNRTMTASRDYKNNMQGNVRFVCDEIFDYDTKGNLTYKKDKIGGETSIQYHEEFSIPSVITRKVTNAGTKEEYKTSYKINDRGLVTDEILLLKNGGGTKVLTTINHYVYDPYGNVIENTDANGITVFTAYDDTNSFPVCTYQDVTIKDWSSSDTHFWIDEPDVEEVRQAIKWFVYNTDGTIWYEVNAAGYAIGRYYDENGLEQRIVKPETGDYTDFISEFISTGIKDFKAYSTHFDLFCESRQNNPGVRIYSDYQNDFVHTVIDTDINTGAKQVTAVQNDGLGNRLLEIKYEVLGSFDEEDITDPNLSPYAQTVRTYDSLGRMVALTDPDAGGTFTEKTVHNTIVQKHDKTWIVYYDDLNRKKEVHYPVTDAGGLPKIKQYTYDNYENAVYILDEEGRAVKEIYDWNENLLKLIQYKDSAMNPSDGLIYTYSYDELNRKIRFIDPSGIVTEFKYDERNLIKEQRYYDAGTDSPFTKDIYTYDTKGRMTTKTDRKGQIIDYSYDERDLLTLETHYNSPQDFADSIPSYSVSIVHDISGNERRITNGTMIEHYGYDVLNRVIQLDRKIEEPVDRFDTTGVFTFSYTYNNADMVTRMTYPDAGIHTYTYDTLARLKTIATDSPFVQNMEYTPSGKVKEMSYANGTTQNWEFDNRKRISRISVTEGNGSTVIDDLRFTVNGVGNICAINDDEYGYDSFNRLTGAKILKPGISENDRDPLKLIDDSFGAFLTMPAADIEGNTYEYIPGGDLNTDNRINGVDFIFAIINKESLYDEEKFEYDKNGNRIRLVQNGDEYIYNYGARNRLVSIKKKVKDSFNTTLLASYVYDANGNITKCTTYGQYGDPLESLFTYDVSNRLTSITKTRNGTPETTSFYYDNAGNRCIKKSYDGSATIYLRHGKIAVAMDIEIPAITETEYMQKENRYVLSGDLLAGRITKTSLVDSTVETENNYYHLDHLNSTKCVTDENARIVVKYTYRAFGEQLKRLDNDGNDTGDMAKYSYGGKELDTEAGLYYFNARYYDAALGRFINVDPIQDGSNWYVYCSNNPLSFTDPTGLNDKKTVETQLEPPQLKLNFPKLSIGFGTEVTTQKLELETPRLKLDSQFTLNSPALDGAEEENPALVAPESVSTTLKLKLDEAGFPGSEYSLGFEHNLQKDTNKISLGATLRNDNLSYSNTFSVTRDATNNTSEYNLKFEYKYDYNKMFSIGATSSFSMGNSRRFGVDFGLNLTITIGPPSKQDKYLKAAKPFIEKMQKKQEQQ